MGDVREKISFDSPELIYPDFQATDKGYHKLIQSINQHKVFNNKPAKDNADIVVNAENMIEKSRITDNTKMRTNSIISNRRRSKQVELTNSLEMTTIFESDEKNDDSAEFLSMNKRKTGARKSKILDYY